MHRALILFLPLFLGCESLEGKRVLIPGADASLLIAGNWQHSEAPRFSEGTAVIEGHSLQEPSVHLKVFVSRRENLRLEDLVTQTLTDAATLEKRGELRIRDVTQMAIDRPTLRGLRVIHQLSLGGGKIAATQIADNLFRPGIGITVLVVGPQEKIDALMPELDSLLGSVRGEQTTPVLPRVQPPDMVSSASQRAARSLLETHEDPSEVIIVH